jgi:hypothetical protein
MSKPINFYIKKLLGIITIFTPIWVGCYVAIDVLPDGWAESPFTHWWTLPTMLTLFASVFSLGILGLSIIFEELF